MGLCELLLTALERLALSGDELAALVLVAVIGPVLLVLVVLVLVPVPVLVVLAVIEAGARGTT